LRSGRKIVAGLSRNSDHTFLLIMPILPVATARSIQIPTILLDELDDRADFHCSESCRFHFGSSNVDQFRQAT